MQNSWEHLFSCDKCGKPLPIKIIKHNDSLVTFQECPNEHRKKFYLCLTKIDECIFLLNLNFFKYVKYDASVNITSIYKGVWVKVQMKCPIHSRNETRLLPMTVYTVKVQAGKQRLSISTTPRPTISENIIFNNCQKNYTLEMLNY